MGCGESKDVLPEKGSSDRRGSENNDVVDVTNKPQAGTSIVPVDDYHQTKDYDDLIYIATKREIKVTIQTSTKAGIAAGLAVMSGTLVAGPVGAAVGGAVGTVMAVSMSRNTIGLNQLLQDTPPEKRGEIIKLFTQSFKEEFNDAINSNAELKLLVGGMTPIGMIRYMVERNILQNEQVQKLDTILSKIV